MGGWALARLHPRPRAQAWGASHLLGALPTCPRSSDLPPLFRITGIPEL